MHFLTIQYLWKFRKIETLNTVIHLWSLWQNTKWKLTFKHMQNVLAKYFRVIALPFQIVACLCFSTGSLELRTSAYIFVKRQKVLKHMFDCTLYVKLHCSVTPTNFVLFHTNNINRDILLMNEVLFSCSSVHNTK